MHLPQYILAFSALVSIISAAPFAPNQQGKLQSQRRRWIDYPIPSAETPLPNNGLRRRSMRKRDVPYSVVPVNGAEPTSVGPTTAVVTVTPTLPTPSVETTVHTSIVTENAPAETILVVTTQPGAAPTPEASIVTETITASPSRSSTKVYDDGLWHTYYPVKSWVTSAAIASPTPVFRMEVRNPHMVKK